MRRRAVGSDLRSGASALQRTSGTPNEDDPGRRQRDARRPAAARCHPRQRGRGRRRASSCACPRPGPRRAVIYDDSVFDAAQARVDLALGFVRSEGIDAIGEVGDPDPYTATMDAVREYRPGRDHHLDLPRDALGLAAPRPDRARPRRLRAARRARGDRPRHRGLPFHVTLAVANRTASGDELLEALKAKASAEPTKHARCSSWSSPRRAARPAPASAPEPG